MRPSFHFKLLTVFSLLLIFVIGLALLQATGLSVYATDTSPKLPIQSSAVGSNWDMLGYSPWHKRVNPYEAVLNKSNVSGLTLDWTVSSGGFIESLDTIVSNGIAYFTSHDGNLYAVNAITGSSLWSKPLGYYDYSSPAVANGILYIGVGKNTPPYSSLYALNAKTGAILWSFDGVGLRSSPIIVHGPRVVMNPKTTIRTINRYFLSLQAA